MSHRRGGRFSVQHMGSLSTKLIKITCILYLQILFGFVSTVLIYILFCSNFFPYYCSHNISKETIARWLTNHGAVLMDCDRSILECMDNMDILVHPTSSKEQNMPTQKMKNKTVLIEVWTYTELLNALQGGQGQTDNSSRVDRSTKPFAVPEDASKHKTAEVPQKAVRYYPLLNRIVSIIWVHDTSTVIRDSRYRM